MRRNTTDISPDKRQIQIITASQSGYSMIPSVVTWEINIKPFPDMQCQREEVIDIGHGTFIKLTAVTEKGCTFDICSLHETESGYEYRVEKKQETAGWNQEIKLPVYEKIYDLIYTLYIIFKDHDKSLVKISTAKFCPNCGKNWENDRLFCSNCGIYKRYI